MNKARSYRDFFLGDKIGVNWAKIYFEIDYFYKLKKKEISSIYLGEEFCQVIDGTSFCLL